MIIRVLLTAAAPMRWAIVFHSKVIAGGGMFIGGLDWSGTSKRERMVRSSVRMTLMERQREGRVVDDEEEADMTFFSFLKRNNFCVEWV